MLDPFKESRFPAKCIFARDTQRARDLKQSLSFIIFIQSTPK